MKWVFLLIALFFNLAAAEQDCEEKHSATILTHQQHDNFHQLKRLNHWAATPWQVLNAKCKSPSPLRMTKILNHLGSVGGDKKITRSFNGLTLEDSPEKLLLLEKLLNKIDYSGNVNKKDAKTFTSKCKDVVCASKEIFGNTRGPKMLYILDKFDYNTSHHSYTNSDPWNTSDLDHLTTALADYPPSLLPFKSTRQLTRFSRGYTLLDYTIETIANSRIAVFDGFDELPKGEKQSVIFHEVAHNIGSEFELDDSKEWQELGSWEGTTKIVDGKEETTFVSKDSKSVSGYGMSSPYEDFAEAIIAYRYNPGALQEISPKKYEYLKEKVFDGLEYTSDSKCQTTQSRSLKYLEELKNNEIKLSSKEVFSGCLQPLLSDLTKIATLDNESSSKALLECMEKNAKDKVYTEMEDVLGSTMKHYLSNHMEKDEVISDKITQKVKEVFEETKDKIGKALTDIIYDNYKEDESLRYVYMDLDKNKYILSQFSEEQQVLEPGYYSRKEIESLIRAAQKDLSSVQSIRTMVGLPPEKDKTRRLVEIYLKQYQAQMDAH